MTTHLARWLMRAEPVLGIVLALSGLLTLRWLPQARVDNSIEVWLDDHSEACQAYHAFQETFGNEEFIVVALETEDPWSPEALEYQRDLADRFARLEHVDTVLAIPEILRQARGLDPNAAESLRSAPLLQGLLIGRDGHHAGLVVTLERFERPDQRRATLAAVEAVVEQTRRDGIAVHLAGTPVMNAALDSRSRSAARTILPLALGLSCVILWAVLRNALAVAAVLVTVGVTVAWTVAAMVLSGKTLNMVTVVLPSLLFVLSVAGAIHLVTCWQAIRGRHDGPRQALRQAWVQTAGPIALAAVTTGLGFLTLRGSAMGPVRDFGTFAGLGMLLSGLGTLIVLPGLLVWVPAGVPTVTQGHWTTGWARRAARRPAVTVLLSASLLAGCGLAARNLHVDPNVLSYFRPDDPIRRDYDFVARELTGLYSLELVVRPGDLKGRAWMDRLDRLQAVLEQRPEVAKVLHYGVLARAQRRAGRTSALADLAGGRHQPLRRLQQRFIDLGPDGRRYRVSIWIRSMSWRQTRGLLDFARQQAAVCLGPETQVEVTGVVRLLQHAQESLVRTQIHSFAWAAALVLALIGLTQGSIRALVAAALPNLLPIAALFALMALLGIALDAATVMIAAVAIGIAADDTIHFLSHFRRCRRRSGDTDTATTETFDQIGRAITFTTAVAVAAFAVLLAAAFRPLQNFGLLASITMVLAWCGDVLILPAAVKLLHGGDRATTPSRGDTSP